MGRIEYHVTLQTKILQIAYCILFAGGVWFVTNSASPLEKSVGRLLTVALVLLSFWLLVRLPKRIVRLTLDEKGIYSASMGTPLIPWSDIVAAKNVYFYGNFLAFLPVDQTERIKQMPWPRKLGVYSNRVFRVPAFCINCNGLSASRKEIYEELGKRIEAVGLKPTGQEDRPH
jgi:hypothetical protein